MKRTIIFILICAVVGLHALDQVTSASDRTVMMKILQSVDAAKSNGRLYDVTLKLLQSLCVCMRETLKEKEVKVIFGDINKQDNDVRTNDLKVLDLYRRVYNSTCINLRKDLLNKIKKAQNITIATDIEDGALLQNTNCGKKIVNEFDIEMSEQQRIRDRVKSKLQDILHTTLIKTQGLHKYNITTRSLFGKAKTSEPEHSVIIILTLHPINKTTQDSAAIEEKELNDTLYSKSPVDIDIIDTKYNVKDKESEVNNDLTLKCNLHSLYVFLIECENQNLTKVVKLLRKNGTIKIYIDVTTLRNHTDYRSICCNNSNVSLCKNFIKDQYEIGEESTTQLLTFNQKYQSKIGNYKDTINKIKNWLKLYGKKLRKNTTSNKTNKLSNKDSGITNTHKVHNPTHSFIKLTSVDMQITNTSLINFSSTLSYNEIFTAFLPNPLYIQLTTAKTEFPDNFNVSVNNEISDINEGTTAITNTDQVIPNKDHKLRISNNLINKIKAVIAEFQKSSKKKEYKNVGDVEIPIIRESEKFTVNINSDTAFNSTTSTKILTEDFTLPNVAKNSNVLQENIDLVSQIDNSNKQLTTSKDGIFNIKPTMSATENEKNNSDIIVIARDASTKTNNSINLISLDTENQRIELSTEKMKNRHKVSNFNNSSEDHKILNNVNKTSEIFPLTTQTTPKLINNTMASILEKEENSNTANKNKTHIFRDIETESWDPSLSEKPSLSTKSMKDIRDQFSYQDTTAAMLNKIKTQITNDSDGTHTNLPTKFLEEIYQNVSIQNTFSDITKTTALQSQLNPTNFNNFNGERTTQRFTESMSQTYMLKHQVNTNTDVGTVLETTTTTRPLNNEGTNQTTQAYNIHKILDKLTKHVNKVSEEKIPEITTNSEYIYSHNSTRNITIYTLDDVSTEITPFTENYINVTSKQSQLLSDTKAHVSQAFNNTLYINNPSLATTMPSPETTMDNSFLPKSFNQDLETITKPSRVDVTHDNALSNLSNSKEKTSLTNVHNTISTNQLVSPIEVTEPNKTPESMIKEESITTKSQLIKENERNTANNIELTTPYKISDTEPMHNLDTSTKKQLSNENISYKLSNKNTIIDIINKQLTSNALITKYLKDLSQNIHSSENTIPYLEKTTKANKELNEFLVPFNSTLLPQIISDKPNVSSTLTMGIQNNTKENENFTYDESFMSKNFLETNKLQIFEKSVATTSHQPIHEEKFKQNKTFTETKLEIHSKIHSNMTEAASKFTYDFHTFRSDENKFKKFDFKEKATEMVTSTKYMNLTDASKISFTVTPPINDKLKFEKIERTTLPYENKHTIQTDEVNNKKDTEENVNTAYQLITTPVKSFTFDIGIDSEKLNNLSTTKSVNMTLGTEANIIDAVNIINHAQNKLNSITSKNQSSSLAITDNKGIEPTTSKNYIELSSKLHNIITSKPVIISERTQTEVTNENVTVTSTAPTAKSDNLQQINLKTTLNTLLKTANYETITNLSQDVKRTSFKNVLKVAKESTYPEINIPTTADVFKLQPSYKDIFRRKEEGSQIEKPKLLSDKKGVSNVLISINGEYLTDIYSDKKTKEPGNDKYYDDKLTSTPGKTTKYKKVTFPLTKSTTILPSTLTVLRVNDSQDPRTYLTTQYTKSNIFMKSLENSATISEYKVSKGVENNETKKLVDVTSDKTTDNKYSSSSYNNKQIKHKEYPELAVTPIKLTIYPYTSHIQTRNSPVNVTKILTQLKWDVTSQKTTESMHVARNKNSKYSQIKTKEKSSNSFYPTLITFSTTTETHPTTKFKYFTEKLMNSQTRNSRMSSEGILKSSDITITQKSEITPYSTENNMFTSKLQNKSLTEYRITSEMMTRFQNFKTTEMSYLTEPFTNSPYMINVQHYHTTTRNTEENADGHYVTKIKTYPDHNFTILPLNLSTYKQMNIPKKVHATNPTTLIPTLQSVSVETNYEANLKRSRLRNSTQMRTSRRRKFNEKFRPKHYVKSFHKKHSRNHKTVGSHNRTHFQTTTKITLKQYFGANKIEKTTTAMPSTVITINYEYVNKTSTYTLNELKTFKEFNNITNDSEFTSGINKSKSSVVGDEKIAKQFSQLDSDTVIPTKPTSVKNNKSDIADFRTISTVMEDISTVQLVMLKNNVNNNITNYSLQEIASKYPNFLDKNMTSTVEFFTNPTTINIKDVATEQPASAFDISNKYKDTINYWETTATDISMKDLITKPDTSRNDNFNDSNEETTKEYNTTNYSTLDDSKINNSSTINTYSVTNIISTTNITTDLQFSNKTSAILEKYQNAKPIVTRSTTSTYSEWLKKRYFTTPSRPPQIAKSLRTIIYNTYKPTTEDELDFSSDIETLTSIKKKYSYQETPKLQTLVTSSYKAPTTTTFKITERTPEISTMKTSTSFYNESTTKLVKPKEKQTNDSKITNITVNYKIPLNKGYLLSPLAKTNLYPIKMVSPKTQRKVMRRIKLSNQKKEIMTMNTKDFFSRRFMTQRTIMKVTQPAMYIPVTSMPRHLVLRPNFTALDKPVQKDRYRPKPLFIKGDIDFPRKDFNVYKYQRPAGSTWRKKVGSIQLQLKTKPLSKNKVVGRPSYGLQLRPIYTKMKISGISRRPPLSRNYFERQTKRDSDEENGLPTFHIRQTNFKYGVSTIRPGLRDSVKRNRRTLFFLSPTVPYNRYF